MPFLGTTKACLTLKAAVATARFYSTYSGRIQANCEGRIIAADMETVLGIAKMDTKEFVGEAWVPITCVLLSI